MENHPRTGNGKFEAFAAHGFDQNAQLQFAAAGNFKGIVVGGSGDFERDVAFRFFFQPFGNHPRGNFVAFAAGQRRIVDRKGHHQRRRVDRLSLKRFGDGKVADGIGNGGFYRAGYGDDVAGMGFFQTLAGQAAVSEDFGDAETLDFVVFAVESFNRVARSDAAAEDFAGQQAADELVGFQRGGQHGKRFFRIADRRRHMGQNQFKKNLQVFFLVVFKVFDRPAVAAGGVKNRKIELFVVGIQADEKIKDFV